MKYLRKLIIPIVVLISLAAFNSCKDNWDDHAQFKQYYSDITLFEKISQNPDLSRFVQYLKVTGYDQILASAQSFTVWVPTNAEFAGIDTTYAIAGDVTVVSDTIKLKKLRQFVKNHIVNQELSSAEIKQMPRVKTLSGKSVLVSNGGNRIQESDVVLADQFCNNGVLHIVSKPVTPQKNIWEFLMSDAKAGTFKNYIKQYDVKVFNPYLSTPLRYEDGFLVYDSVFSQSNSFMLEYGRLDSEDSLYTFILLTDEALNAERDRLITYFTANTQKETDSVLYWNIYKDFVIDGKYTIDNIPSELTSADGVKVPFDKNAVVSSYQASNGMVYVLNSCSISVSNKLKPVIIDPNEAQWKLSSNNSSTFYDRYANSNPLRGSVKTRQRIYAMGGYDFLYTGFGGTKGVVMFPTPLYSNVKYKFYWTAVNDFQTAPIAQSLSLTGNVPTFIPSDSIRYNPTPTAEDFNNEVYLGEGSTNLYGNYSIKVYSGYTNGNSTTPIVLNYIKIVPVVE